MTLRLIQFGLGGWGRSWIEEVTRATPGIAPVAWVDPDPTMREQAIAAFGLPAVRVYGTADEALHHVAADAALVVVPLALHTAVTQQALQAGLHVLVEKPFTDNLSEAAMLVALARQEQRVLMVNQNFRWFPAPRLARRWLAERRIGRLIAGYLDFHWFFGAGYRYFFLEEPLLSDMAIHHFDALRFVLDDEPIEVSCHSWNEPDSPFKGRPAAVATIRFAGGALINYRGSWISRGPATPYGGTWRLDGTGGTLEFSYRGAFAQRETLDRMVLHRPGKPSRIARLPSMPYKDRRGALRDFARAVRAGQLPVGASAAADNIKSLALMFAAIRSARDGGAMVRVDDIVKDVPA